MLRQGVNPAFRRRRNRAENDPELTVLRIFDRISQRGCSVQFIISVTSPVHYSNQLFFLVYRGHGRASFELLVGIFENLDCAQLRSSPMLDGVDHNASQLLLRNIRSLSNTLPTVTVVRLLSLILK